jgi:heptosyltransferase-1
LARLILPAAGEERGRIDKFWADHGLHGAEAVVLHIGAGNEFRDWGARNLGQLAARLAALPGVRVLLVGSSQDIPKAEEIRRKGGPEVLSLAGELNLIELREVVSRARLFVGPDSGPMHVAAATSTPIVAFFGPNLPEYNAPWKAAATIIEKKLDCRPCKQRRCVTGDFRCLKSITVDEVLEACLGRVGD